MNTNKIKNTPELQQLKIAVQMMAQGSGLSLQQIVERFWESRGLIAAGFEAFAGTDIAAGDAVKLMKESAIENDDMLRDIERSLLYGMMYIVTPRGKTKEESQSHYIPEILETVGFIHTIMGEKFFNYVLKRRTQGLKASVDKMRKMIAQFDDKQLIHGMNMPNKDEAMLEMIEAKEQLAQHNLKKQRSSNESTSEETTKKESKKPTKG